MTAHCCIQLLAGRGFEETDTLSADCLRRTGHKDYRSPINFDRFDHTAQFAGWLNFMIHTPKGYRGACLQPVWLRQPCQTNRSPISIAGDKCLNLTISDMRGDRYFQRVTAGGKTKCKTLGPIILHHADRQHPVIERDFKIPVSFLYPLEERQRHWAQVSDSGQHENGAIEAPHFLLGCQRSTIGNAFGRFALRRRLFGPVGHEGIKLFLILGTA